MVSWDFEDMVVLWDFMVINYRGFNKKTGVLVDYPLADIYIPWTDPPFLIGKLMISMAIFLYFSMSLCNKFPDGKASVFCT